MTRFRTLAIGLTLSVLVPSHAFGRGIVIDQAEFLPFLSPVTPCTIGGAACTATTLPFTLNLSSGATTDAFIYDRGIISFGAPIPGGVDANADFTTFGVPVIAPLYAPGNTGDAGPYSEVEAGAAAPGDFNLHLSFTPSGGDMFVVTFHDPSLGDDGDFLQGLVTVVIDATPDAIHFEYLHGMSNLVDGVRTTVLPNTVGTQLGFAIEGQTHLDDPPDIEGVNAFAVALGAAAVPEPATWLAMLLGFGIIGLAFRRSRRSLAPAF